MKKLEEFSKDKTKFIIIEDKELIEKSRLSQFQKTIIYETDNSSKNDSDSISAKQRIFQRVYENAKKYVNSVERIYLNENEEGFYELRINYKIINPPKKYFMFFTKKAICSITAELLFYKLKN
jgi:uncharacterized GH25 family protein